MGGIKKFIRLYTVPGPKFAHTQLAPTSLLQQVNSALCLTAAAASTFQHPTPLPSHNTSDDVTALESISTDKLMQSRDIMQLQRRTYIICFGKEEEQSEVSH